MYKDWTAICKIVERHMLWAVATLDLDSKMGERFIKAFPEYFSEEESPGPYPLSLIREEGHKAGPESDEHTDGDMLPATYDSLPKWMSTLSFDISGCNSGLGDLSKLPEEIDPKSKQGDVVKYLKYNFVVIEVNMSLDEMTLVPAENIAIGL